MSLDSPTEMDSSVLIDAVRTRTPARLLVGRAGASYRTATQLQLRLDHAAARDAVQAELDVERDLGPELLDRFQLFSITTRASSKQEYLLRPDLGRSFADDQKERIRTRCPAGRDLQIVIGDGLSATAVAAQVPALLPLLVNGAGQLGWTVGRPFVIFRCRVGILNAIGELLDPKVVVLLIGERPGLATADSLSAYMAYRPRNGYTDAQRNLISNIHARGVRHDDAVRRILALADTMMRVQASGVTVKEDGTAAGQFAPPDQRVTLRS